MNSVGGTVGKEIEEEHFSGNEEIIEIIVGGYIVEIESRWYLEWDKTPWEVGIQRILRLESFFSGRKDQDDAEIQYLSVLQENAYFQQRWDSYRRRPKLRYMARYFAAKYTISHSVFESSSNPNASHAIKNTKTRDKDNINQNDPLIATSWAQVIMNFSTRSDRFLHCNPFCDT
ncbi:hypothetical protein CIHG_00848 [Coccidioides immitis H538.4]|uniref:Uncharacterized protein n=1 Tax=Coccidioides immitis H538.4 TaxID=396776 RepID=A0A0J8RDQ6_COCIT|nr:hypothetical protein CIHG_00848 [Coccidioides immitis H538.4]